MIVSQRIADALSEGEPGFGPGTSEPPTLKHSHKSAELEQFRMLAVVPCHVQEMTTNADNYAPHPNS